MSPSPFPASTRYRLILIGLFLLAFGLAFYLLTPRAPSAPTSPSAAVIQSEARPALPSAAPVAARDADVSAKVSEILSQARPPSVSVPEPTESPKENLPEIGQEWSGTDSRIHDGRQVVIHSTAEWESLWRAHRGADATVPPVDFARAMVVGVFLGARADACRRVVIAQVRDIPDQRVVEWGERLPEEAADCPVSEAFPFVLRVVSRTALPVHFQTLRPS